MNATPTHSPSIESVTTNGLHHFVKYTRPRRRLFFFKSLLFELPAWLLLISAVLSLWWLLTSPDEVTATDVYGGLSWLSGLAVSSFLFGALRRRAKRYRLSSARILKRARRAPIVYLREFYKSDPEVMFLDIGQTDEILTRVLSSKGPVIAVGRPGEKVPPLGAVRVYFEDDVWQRYVEELMSMAQLVIIQAGRSPGLDWEVTTALERVKPSQLLITFLSWQELDEDTRTAKYEAFKARVEVTSKVKLPDALRDQQFIGFDNDWNGTVRSLHQIQLRFFSLMTFLGDLIFSGILMQGTFHNFNRVIQLRNPLRETTVVQAREELRLLLGQHGVRFPVWGTLLYFSLSVLAIMLVISFLFLILLKAAG